MFQRLCVATVAAAFAALSMGTMAQAPATPAGGAASAVPPNTCVKPDFPGRLASSSRITAFNKEYTAYRECTNKYIDATKKLANDAIAAGNAAVDDFNKFAAEIKAQNDANN